MTEGGERRRAVQFKPDLTEFVRTWQSAKCLEEVSDRFGCAVHQAYHLAKVLRKAGVNLKPLRKERMQRPRLRAAIPVAELNALVDSLGPKTED